MNTEQESTDSEAGQPTTFQLAQLTCMVAGLRPPGQRQGNGKLSPSAVWEALTAPAYDWADEREGID